MLGVNYGATVVTTSRINSTTQPTWTSIFRTVPTSPLWSSPSSLVVMTLYLYGYIYIYIYIVQHWSVCVCVYMCLYIYAYGNVPDVGLTFWWLTEAASGMCRLKRRDRSELSDVHTWPSAPLLSFRYSVEAFVLRRLCVLVLMTLVLYSHRFAINWVILFPAGDPT